MRKQLRRKRERLYGTTQENKTENTEVIMEKKPKRGRKKKDE